jgi:hypothetical protein
VPEWRGGVGEGRRTAGAQALVPHDGSGGVALGAEGEDEGADPLAAGGLGAVRCQVVHKPLGVARAAGGAAQEQHGVADGRPGGSEVAPGQLCVAHRRHRCCVRALQVPP